jgi:hypothetical protein
MRWSCCEDAAGAKRTQPPVDCLWCLEPSRIKRNTLIIFLFLYVILFLYTLICHYMHETWSWHAYSYALGFLWKNRCDNQSETLGVDGAPRGLPLARILAPKTHSIKRNRKSTLKNTFPWKPPKAPKLKPFRRVCWVKVTKQRATRSSYVTSNKNPSKKCPQNFPTKNPRKDPENNQKGKMGATHPSLKEPRRIIYTYQRGSYKV